MPALPSLTLLGDEAKSELEAQERAATGLDSKAGIVTGFAGILVALSLGNLHGALAHVGAAFAGASALLSALAFFPRRTPVLNLRELRDTYLTAEEEFTRLRLLDTRISMINRTRVRIGRKANLLMAAVLALSTAVILILVAGIVGK